MGIDRANASGAELTWLAVGLVAGFVNLCLWFLATRDLLAVYEAKVNGAKKIEAWTWHVANSLLVATQAIAVGVGLFAAASPRGGALVGLVAVTGLIAMQALNAAHGLYLLWQRGRLDAYLDRERATRRGTPDAEARRRAAQRDARGGIEDDDD